MSFLFLHTCFSDTSFVLRWSVVSAFKHSKRFSPAKQRSNVRRRFVQLLATPRRNTVPSALISSGSGLTEQRVGRKETARPLLHPGTSQPAASRDSQDVEEAGVRLCSKTLGEPRQGLEQWQQEAETSVTPRPNGSWHAHLPTPKERPSPSAFFARLRLES